MKKDTKKNLEVGLGATAIAAIAGAVYLYGTASGKKARKEIKSWSLKAKGEVLEHLENMKDATQEGYEKAIDKVENKYKKMKNVDSAELAALMLELKTHWNNIQKSFSNHNVKKTPKKATPKGGRKTATKAKKTTTKKKTAKKTK